MHAQELDAENDAVTKPFEVSNSAEYAAAVNEINDDDSNTGNYVIKLTDNIPLNGDYYFEKNTTTILGEGHTISGGNNVTVGVRGTATLNLGSADATDTLKLDGAVNHSDGPMLNIIEEATVNMYDGVTIQNSTPNGNPGGVQMGGNSTFNMYGGIIDNCNTNPAFTLPGGMLVNSGCTFNMTGGTIQNCSGVLGGGVLVNGGTFKMTDGTIKNCSATYGGGITVYGSTNATIANSVITENTAEIGGGILLMSGSSMTVSGTGNVICNNTATDDISGGADIFLNDTVDTITLPDAASMNATYKDTGKKIDGWYSDSPRYTPSEAGVPVDVSKTLSGELALVASYRVIPTHTVKVDVVDGAAYDNAACTGTPITEAEEGSTVYLKYTGSDPGKQFEKWTSVSEGVDFKGTETTAEGASFVMPKNDVVISAEVSTLYTLTLPKVENVKVDGEPAVTGTDANGNLTVTAKAGAVITFTKPADANVSYTFVGRDAKTELKAENGVYTVIMPSYNTSVEAAELPQSIETKDDTVTITAYDENDNLIHSAYAGAKVYLSYAAEDLPEGTEFKGWQVTETDGTAVEVKAENGKYYFIMPDSAVTVELLTQPVQKPDEKLDITTKDDSVTITTTDENGSAVRSSAAGAKIYLSYELADLPEGTMFKAWQVTQPDGTAVEVKTEGSKYYFIMPDTSVTVELLTQPINEDPDAPADRTFDTVAAVAGAATMTTAIGATGYLVGTHLYLETVFGYVPANRQALATALWTKANKPEPQSTALYTDVSADETDAQKADRWCVEQGLLPAKSDDTFKPGAYVTRVQCIKSWKALEKLLNNN